MSAAVVWTCQYGSVDGGSLHRVCVSREVAMQWLEQRHEYERLNAERMTAHVRERNPEAEEWGCTAICEEEMGRVGFTAGGFDHYWIQKRAVELAGPDTETAEVIARWREERPALSVLRAKDE